MTTWHPIEDPFCVYLCELFPLPSIWMVIFILMIIQNGRWEGLKTFLKMERSPIYCKGDKSTKAFTKSYKNLRFYWILGAGHFVSKICPLDHMFISTYYIVSPNSYYIINACVVHLKTPSTLIYLAQYKV